MAKFYCTQRFFEERTYYEQEPYDLSEAQVVAFNKSGQLKRMQPVDEEAKSLVAELESATAGEPGAPPARKRKPAKEKGKSLDEGMDIQKANRTQLAAVAEGKGIKVTKEMTKAQLIEAITAADQE